MFSRIGRLVVVLACFSSVSIGCGHGQRSTAVTPAETSDPGLLFSHGTKLAGIGQYARAEEYLLAAWKAGISASEVTPLLIRICMADGRLRSALSFAERARKEQPDDPRLIHLTAVIQRALGEEQRAARTVEELVIAQPEYPEALLFLGEYFIETRDVERGVALLHQYLDRFPNADEGPWAQHLIELAQRGLPSLAEPAELPESSMEMGRRDTPEVETGESSSTTAVMAEPGGVL